jgi:hypothetical protein
VELPAAEQTAPLAGKRAGRLHSHRVSPRGNPDSFETLGGARPEAVPLAEALGAQFPLDAFALLTGGDAFEDLGGAPPVGGEDAARAYVDERVSIDPQGAAASVVEDVRAVMARQLSGNLQLVERLGAGRPIEVVLIPSGAPMWRFGFPKVATPHAVGLFWDDPQWRAGRMALRQEHLGTDPVLVVHEMAHAIHCLAFTKKERELMYRVMLPRFGSRAMVDEVFAVYTEREFGGEFAEREKRAPGIYGLARRQWSENHVFTRFVRHLYFPYKPLAGPPSRAGWF